ncbi:transcription antitermination protein NusB [Candidatus Collierbacteria bacterium]|nr:transcription antitermination protein NusB [Candidatus Collierbacteria bacterium]
MVEASDEGQTKRINKVDKAVLTVAIWELAIEKKTPPKVIIDEAVELAKEFGSESSPGFVNGVLGAILSRGASREARSGSARGSGSAGMI